MECGVTLRLLKCEAAEWQGNDGSERIPTTDRLLQDPLITCSPNKPSWNGFGGAMRRRLEKVADSRDLATKSEPWLLPAFHPCSVVFKRCETIQPYRREFFKEQLQQQWSMIMLLSNFPSISPSIFQKDPCPPQCWTWMARSFCLLLQLQMSAS